jgi:WD40 repeat protein
MLNRLQSLYIRDAVFSPDGLKMAISDGGIIQYWNLETETGGLEYSFSADMHCSILKFSPNGTRLLACDGHYRYAVWDTRDWSCLYYAEDGGEYPRWQYGLVQFTSDQIVAVYQDPMRYADSADFTRMTLTRRRPEAWWGIFYLPEMWLTIFLLGTLVFSMKRDRKVLAA